MPRGSRPGERRGGRQRGTPNKKTLLKNAAFLAAAGEPNRSPLDFMLALMRDPQVPLDDRIDLAAKAAPFVHARPAPVRKSDDLKFAKLEAKPGAADGDRGEGGVASGGEGAGGSDGEGFSPLDFLLGVMADPAADSEQRVKAAAVAARYKHAIAAPDPEAPSIVVADKFGFTVAPDLARAERDDRLREGTLEATSHLRRKDSLSAKEAEQELEQIGKRRAQRLVQLTFPDGYAYADRQTDEKRLAQLSSKRASRKKLTPDEDAEEAHLAVRVLNPKVVKPKVPAEGAVRVFGGPFEIEWPATRIAELDERVVGGETLIAAEEGERQDLRRRYPESAAQADKLDHRYRYWLRKEREIALKAGIEYSKAIKAADAKCEALRDPTKIVYADLPSKLIRRLYRLESLCFDELLTPEEADELEEFHRLYPQRTDRARKFVHGRLSDDRVNNDYMVRTGSRPRPIEQGQWPRIWTVAADGARSRTPGPPL